MPSLPVNEPIASQPVLRDRRKRSAILRGVVLFVAVVIAPPATAGVVWMIQEHALRQKYSREGLPPDAPLDRTMLKERDIVASFPSSEQHFQFRFLADRLDVYVRAGAQHRNVSPEEWFFYCGPPDFVKRSAGTIEYLYVPPAQPYGATEVLLTIDESKPHVVAESEIRYFRITNGSTRPSGTSPPFSREGFQPYTPESKP